MIDKSITYRQKSVGMNSSLSYLIKMSKLSITLNHHSGFKKSQNKKYVAINTCYERSTFYEKIDNKHVEMSKPINVPMRGFIGKWNRDGSMQILTREEENIRPHNLERESNVADRFPLAIGEVIINKIVLAASNVRIGGNILTAHQTTTNDSNAVRVEDEIKMTKQNDRMTPAGQGLGIVDFFDNMCYKTKNLSSREIIVHHDNKFLH